ncbi:ROK family protein [Nonomuraea thailandensis]
MDHNRADGHATDSASRGGPAGAPADQATVRRSNLALVLRHVSANGPCSRSAVAVATGLNKATVTSLVNELQARGLVREMGPQHAGSVGRPGVALALDGSRAGALGVEVNVDYTAAIATDLAGRVLIDRRIGFDAMGSGPERSLDELARMVETTVADLDRLGVTPAGITVAVPGLVDTTTGTVVVAPNLGWRGVPVAERLSHIARDIPIAVDNDANLAALAEYTSGVAAGTPTWSASPARWRRRRRHLRRPAPGRSGRVRGEIGHVMIDPSGERCRCGRVGCWETKVGLAALVRMATPNRPYGTGPQVVRDPEERLAEIEQRRAGGDPRAEAAVAEVGRWLGIGAALLINLFNPRVIVLGGYFARLADPLIPAAQRELARTGMSDAVERCRFAASDLGFGAASRGAAGVVVERALSDPTSISIRTSPAVGVIEGTPTVCSPRSS